MDSIKKHLINAKNEYLQEKAYVKNLFAPVMKTFLQKMFKHYIKFEREGGIRGKKGGRGVVGREVEIKYKLDRVGPVVNRPTTD